MKEKYTHRIAYELWRGSIPNGMHVCHRCDVPPCINPDHLFLGTDQDNVNDMVAKGRDIHGERSSLAKLSDEQVWRIRTDNRSNPSIAADYGVTANSIWRIKNFHSRVRGKFCTENMPDDYRPKTY